MSRASKLFERCLWAVGFLALGACALVWLNARLEQDRGNQELDRRIHSPLKKDKQSPAHDSVIGRIEIPRLSVSAVVFEGTDSPVLGHGIGHLTGSHLPGERGNVVFAGHRDTFFRALKDIHPHDLITVTTEEGTRRYSVQSTAIVDPDQTSVLQDTSSPTLTLITCYPFYYVGQAPQRFVVRSREVAEKGPDPGFAAVVYAAAPEPMIVRRPERPVPVQKTIASIQPFDAVTPLVAALASKRVDPPDPKPVQIDPPKQRATEYVAPAEPVPAPPQTKRRSLRSRINPVRLAGRLVHALRNSGQ